MNATTRSQTELLNSASELWQTIVQGAGIDLERYDGPLVAELAASLGISATDFAGALDRAGVPVEKLLVHLLKLMAPYGEMMKEILAFFTRAGAQSSATNLRIRFEFDNAQDSLDFDLSNFRDLVVSFSEKLTTIRVDEIDELQALQLRHAFMFEGITYQVVHSQWREITPSDAEVMQWLAAGPVDSAISRGLPGPPDVVNVELGNLLARVWQILNTSSAGASVENNAAFSSEDIRLIVRGAYLLKAHEDLLLKQLRAVFKGIQTTEMAAKVLFEHLLEVFNLPVWKRRSEFYSVWVGAKLITELGDSVRIHVVDRTLVFSFGGAHLATARLPSGDNLHVWCELRTNASALIGQGRKRAIQPDYVVLREPTSHPSSAVLVVECKQYLTQSRKKFAAALIDYARTHHEAEICLVNYGTITDSVISRVAELDSSLTGRTRAIGSFRPRSPIAISEFEEMVRNLAALQETPELPGTELGVRPQRSEQATGAKSGSLHLSWESDADLDIHCWMTDGGGNRQHVYYGKQRAKLAGAIVELDKDVRTSGEEENLNWKNAKSISLDFAVHAFSRGAEIASARPQLEVKAFGRKWSIEHPVGIPGRWWNLFRIEDGGSNIQIWNSISDSPPFSEEEAGI